MKRMALILMAVIMLSSFVSAYKIESVKVEVHKYDGTYPCGGMNVPITLEDSWGEFNGICSYLGPYYYYTTILVKLDNGVRLRYIISLRDNRGTTTPAPTVLGSASGPQRIEQTQTFSVGDDFWVWMNDNYNDNNYVDGRWHVFITETSIQAIYAAESGGYFHNTSMIVMNVDTGENWTVPLPFKSHGEVSNYNFTIPTDGSNATVTDLKHNETYTYSPPNPSQLFGAPPKKAPVPIGVVIFTAVIILMLTEKRKV